MNMIRKSGGIMEGTRNPGINVPFSSQEIIMGACFALKHHRRCGEKFHPSLVNLDILEELLINRSSRTFTTTRRLMIVSPFGTQKIVLQALI